LIQARKAQVFSHHLEGVYHLTGRNHRCKSQSLAKEWFLKDAEDLDSQFFLEALAVEEKYCFECFLKPPFCRDPRGKYVLAFGTYPLAIEFNSLQAAAQDETYQYAPALAYFVTYLIDKGKGNTEGLMKLLKNIADEFSLPEAEYNYGMRIFREDALLGKKYLERAAQHGWIDAGYQMSEIYLKEKDYNRAVWGCAELCAVTGEENLIFQSLIKPNLEKWNQVEEENERLDHFLHFVGKSVYFQLYNTPFYRGFESLMEPAAKYWCANIDRTQQSVLCLIWVLRQQQIFFPPELVQMIGEMAWETRDEVEWLLPRGEFHNLRETKKIKH
jgi:hypothetical protein